MRTPTENRTVNQKGISIILLSPQLFLKGGMRFCSACDNMLYISLRAASGPVEEMSATGTIEGDAETSAVEGASASAAGAGAPLRLTYTCKHCGATEEAEDGASEEAATVLRTDYTDDQTAYKQYVSPFIAHDPTLPRVDYIKCPNAACPKPEAAPNEVIYVKYDPVHLKYLYHCTHCRSFWKTGGGAVAASTASAAPDTAPVAAAAPKGPAKA